MPLALKKIKARSSFNVQQNADSLCFESDTAWLLCWSILNSDSSQWRQRKTCYAESENGITFDVTFFYKLLEFLTTLNCNGFYIVSIPLINTKKIPLCSQPDITWPGEVWGQGDGYTPWNLTMSQKFTNSWSLIVIHNSVDIIDGGEETIHDFPGIMDWNVTDIIDGKGHIHI